MNSLSSQIFKNYWILLAIIFVIVRQFLIYSIFSYYVYPLFGSSFFLVPILLIVSSTKEAVISILLWKGIRESLPLPVVIVRVLLTYFCITLLSSLFYIMPYYIIYILPEWLATMFLYASFSYFWLIITGLLYTFGSLIGRMIGAMIMHRIMKRWYTTSIHIYDVYFAYFSWILLNIILWFIGQLINVSGSLWINSFYLIIPSLIQFFILWYLWSYFFSKKNVLITS